MGCFLRTLCFPCLGSYTDTSTLATPVCKGLGWTWIFNLFHHTNLRYTLCFFTVYVYFTTSFYLTMTRIFTIFILFLLSFNASAQLDTIHVYDGLDISYMFREDTVLMSQRKFNGIVELMRSERESYSICLGMNDKFSKLAEYADAQTKECIEVSRMYEETSIMYRSAYEYTIDKLEKTNNLLKQGVEMTKQERKKVVFNGAVVGVLSGFVIGAITTAIILK